MSIQISSHLGTVALESFIVKLLKALNLDKNRDGKVDKSEIFGAIAEIAPEFFNINNVMAETRDLTQSEFQHLIEVAVANMPDYPNVRQEIEEVIKVALEFVGVGAKLILAIKDLSIPAAPAPVKPVATKPPVLTPAPKPTPAPAPLPMQAPGDFKLGGGK